jgi:4-nitrophenyl phosphatase
MADFHALQDIECFLLDMDGTFYMGDRLLPGALEFIHWLEERHTPYFFLTNNSSKHRRQYAGKLRRMGLEITDEKIFTSSEATALYMKQHYPAVRLYVVGTPALEEEFTLHGFDLVQENPDCAVLGFDTTLTYDKLWKLCNYVRAGLPYIATHPDFNCPTEDGYMPDIGSMIALVAASTGRQPDIVIGKPNPPIVQMLVEKTGVPTARMAMIGDRLYTDIAMGQAGLKTILVLSGETHPEDLAGSPFQPDYIVKHLAELLEKIQEK